ncbi:hypothetical protein JMJ35_006073 [Cladonia borealis]|uniref:Uncharacterized protein n=1 Tax=Cladonia borealis TaxID=184061 RepID=A0AA39V823_9LECA|nr:hypothetical protein JMJ35_006073 [Cladonia borealis]
MKLLLQSIGLLAATAIALPSLSTKDPHCGELEKGFAEMAYLANYFGSESCTTDNCVAFRKGIEALAVEMNHLGCNEPEVNAGARMKRRKERPEYYSKCDAFHSYLFALNKQLENELLTPSDENDGSYTNKCVSVHESLPEIDIWSNRCADIDPTIGNATVAVISSLQRLGCVWSSNCGPGCVQIGNNMFETVRMMGPMQCNRFDPPGDPHERDIRRPTL